MKLNKTLSTLLALISIAAFACKPKEVQVPSYEYSLSLAPVVQQNAPALQSFAHGSVGDDWLLFAGRTNRVNDDGGLHDINGKNANYANTSFLPLSFNEDIFVYNVKDDSVWSLSFRDLASLITYYEVPKGTPNEAALKVLLPKIGEAITAHSTVFRNTNPLVTQDDEGYLYLLGGYGTEPGQSENPNGYITFNQVARIHVPSLINIIKQQENPTISNVDWENLFAFGSNTKLVSTGGEMFKIGDTFYMAGGHNFGSTASNGQKYVDAVYPFTLSKSADLELSISVSAPISDLPEPEINSPSADDISKFRRRDCPIVPALFADGDQLSAGLTFYGGVFQPDSVVTVMNNGQPVKNKDGKDSTVSYLRAWNDAIYIHPGIGSEYRTEASPYYTIDPSFYQANLNVYSCPDIELYDVNSNTVVTFLIGGIGNGAYQTYETLSEFTNTLLKVKYDVKAGTSSKELASSNIFNSSNFYGAEAALFYKGDANVPFVTAKEGKTEVINPGTIGFDDNGNFDLGFVYGGIEAFEGGPGTFGPGKSAASNKIWKVTLNRTND